MSAAYNIFLTSELIAAPALRQFPKELIGLVVDFAQRALSIEKVQELIQRVRSSESPAGCLDGTRAAWRKYSGFHLSKDPFTRRVMEILDWQSCDSSGSNPTAANQQARNFAIFNLERAVADFPHLKLPGV